jgi:hypothetical protein
MILILSKLGYILAPLDQKMESPYHRDDGWYGELHLSIGLHLSTFPPSFLTERFFFFSVLRFELRDLHLVGRCSTL